MFIRCAGCNQRIRHQRAGAVPDILIGIQAEHKALAGSRRNDLPDFLSLLLRLKDFLFLEQRDFGRQVCVFNLDRGFHHSRLIVGKNKLCFVLLRIADITGRRLHLRDNVLAQRKNLGHITACFRRRDRVHQRILLKPYRAVSAHDILSGAYFKDRACKIPQFKDGLLVFVAVSIGHRFKAGKLQALLFQPELALDRIIGNLDIQLIDRVRRIALAPNEHGKVLTANQVSFGRLHFLNEVQAPGHGFRQRHASGFIRGEGVDFLLTRIIHHLLDVLAVCVLELEGRVCQRDDPAGFRIRLDETQTIENRHVGQRQDRRVGQVFRSLDLKEDRAFDLIAILGNRLPQHIHAIRQRFGHRVAVFIGDEIIPFQLACILIRACAGQIDLKLRAFFRRFHALRIRIGIVVAQQLDDCSCTVKDFIGLEAVIDDDRFLRLICCAACVHEEMFITGSIPSRRRHFHDLILAGP